MANEKFIEIFSIIRKLPEEKQLAILQMIEGARYIAGKR